MGEFMSLAAYVRSAIQVPVPPAAAAVSSESVAPCEAASKVHSETSRFVHADVVRELALLRLAAIEAFELSVPRLLDVLAQDVLGRELLLAPADIAALVTRALATFAEHEPIAITVAPCDVLQVRAPLPVRSNSELRAGDLAIEVRDGAFESHFTLRLEQALERARQAA